MITIRKAMPEDLDALLHFEQEIIKAERLFDSTIKDEKVNYYDLASMLRDAMIAVAVAEINNEMIGTGYARIEAAKPYLKHAKHAYLGFMYVHHLYRGRGINNMIIDWLTRFALSKGITELRLDVYAGNEAAIRAYEKAGFVNHIIEMRKEI